MVSKMKIKIGDKEIKCNADSFEISYNLTSDVPRSLKRDNTPIKFERSNNCEGCKYLEIVLQNVNGEIMHCGFTCKKTSMRADTIIETSKCYLYTLM